MTSSRNALAAPASGPSAELTRSLRAFREIAACQAALWSARPTDGAPGAPVTYGAPTLVAGSRADPPLAPPEELPPPGDPRLTRTADGEALVAAVPGVPGAWITVGPCEDGRTPLAALADFLVPVVARQLQAAVEVDHAARELTERYEEINLLYTISEILGRAVTLEETAGTILDEVSETVGASRASILVHDRVTDTLQAVAALGVSPADVAPIAVDDERAVAARVFRTLHPVIVEDDESLSPAEEPYRRGAVLSVPILWSTPGGGEPLGVVNLSGRRGGQSFTAGDLKLVAAIAAQIGAAIKNARLVRASLEQQRHAQEMALAHDLQMKLLPATDVVAPDARVAARVVPAESVGGDFYHLFRVGGGRTGVMIGDVSSHGYRAALIMALAMSASAIHAQASVDPAETLAAVLRSLRDELSSTEMFISAFYGVLDPARGELRFANAGHPHAFVLRGDGECERLAATAPPLGMVDDGPRALVRPWDAGRDALLLFTDGVSDARDRDGLRLGEEAVLDAARRARGGEPSAVLERIFDRLRAHTGDAAPRDDLTVVVARN